MLDAGRLLPLISQILGVSKQYSRGEYYFYCPFCAHKNPKLAVNLQKGAWQCWTCRARGGKLTSLFRRLSVSREQIRELGVLLNDEIPYIQTDKTNAELRLPLEYLPLWKPSNSIKYKHAVAYLQSRNITAYDIIRYEMGYCESGLYADRIIIPSYDAQSKLNYFVSRAFFDNMRPYQNPPVSKNVVGLESHINWNFPVTLVEGMFDAIAVKQNAIPLFGKTIPSKLKKTLIDKKVASVNIALDTDAMDEIISDAEELIRSGLSVNYVELSDKDPSLLGYEEVRKAIHDATPITFSSMVELKLKRQ